jgi:uncharacterized protein YigE (DUF2233 family)
MKKLSAIIAFLFVTGSAAGGATPKAAYVWSVLTDGFLYATFSVGASDEAVVKIHAFQIDPAKFRLDVVTADDEKSGANAEGLAKANKAMLVINGGFFTPDHRSIGLIVKGGKETSPIHHTSWWSIFTLEGDAPRILKPNQFIRREGTSMALQAGPRLVIDGQIPKLKEGIAARSAVGITSDGKVVIAITSGMGMSMDEIARRMSLSRWQGGLECKDAMALDGGSSSQLYAKLGKFELNLSGVTLVTNGLAVFER